MATTVPTANGVPLDQFNDALRASPAWQAFIRRNGFQPNGPIRLSGNQREALKRQLQQAGIAFPKGMEIDPAGNVNQDQGVSKIAGNKWVQIGLIAGASALTMGAAGFGPLAGMMGGSTAAGTGAAAAGTAAAGGVAAGTTAATAAGLSSWLTPALAYGAPAVTGLIAAKMQGNAERDAAGLQSEYLNRALEVEKEKEQYQRGQRADYLGRLKPYNEAGTAAVGRASDLLTTSRYRPEVGGAAGGGAMVALRDSQGVVRQVPASEADRFIQMGAQRV